MKEYTKIEQLQFDTDIIAVHQENYPTHYPLHWHQFVECIALPQPEGSAVVSLNQKPITITGGDLLLVWPGELHEVIDNSGRSMVALQFPLSLLNSKKEFAAITALFRKHQYFSAGETPILNEFLLGKLKRILSISKDVKDSFRNIRMSICLYEMFLAMAEHLQESLAEQQTMTATAEPLLDKISFACSYITDHCTENLTLAAVASQVGFSDCYFSRQFKAVTTHSFVEYLLIQRINRFQVLLSDGNLSITEAAFHAGFKSISTVNRVFSKYCGCSPREYRKLLFR